MPEPSARTVLVTGCSSGIGLETALAFARRGDRVWATIRDLNKADVLRAAAENAGVDITLLQLDVAEDASVASAIGAIQRQDHAIDILVNNAGLAHGGPIEETDPRDARQVLETNLWGAVRTIQAVLPSMRRQGSGLIVNVTSAAARVPGGAFSAFYSASKTALGALSESLWWEVGPHGVRVACVEPGYFPTEVIANAMRRATPTSAAYRDDQMWFARLGLERMNHATAHPSAVADAIVELADDPHPPLHNVVGADALEELQLLARSETFETWAVAVAGQVEQVSGPRPPPGDDDAGAVPRAIVPRWRRVLRHPARALRRRRSARSGGTA